DDVARTDAEFKGLATDGAVELLAGGKPAGVMHEHGLTAGSGGAGALLDIPVLEAGGGLRALTGDFGRATSCWMRGSRLLCGRGGFLGGGGFLRGAALREGERCNQQDGRAKWNE